jgi:hypothetical protein
MEGMFGRKGGKVWKISGKYGGGRMIGGMGKMGLGWGTLVLWKELGDGGDGKFMQLEIWC